MPLMAIAIQSTNAFVAFGKRSPGHFGDYRYSLGFFKRHFSLEEKKNNCLYF